MFSNLQRIVVLTLLTSAASVTLAAPASVSTINTRSTSSESDVRHLERLLENRNLVQLKMQQQLDDLVLEIRELRGQLERSDYEMQKMLKRQNELSTELENVKSRAKTDVKSSVDTSTASESNTGTEPSGLDIDSAASDGTFSGDVDEQAAYQSAVDLILKKQDYDGAIDAFQKFQKNYPSSNFMPNASYWLGQLYFAKKQDEKATSNFTDVLSYSESSKRVGALIKLGDIAQRNDNIEQARVYYELVLSEYPDSEEASLAKEYLN